MMALEERTFASAGTLSAAAVGASASSVSTASLHFDVYLGLVGLVVCSKEWCRSVALIVC
jgi:hypothetical protein